MQSLRNEKSLELMLRRLVDQMVLEPEQKKIALRKVKKLLHANRVSDVRSLRKAIGDFLGVVLLGNESGRIVD